MDSNMKNFINTTNSILKNFQGWKGTLEDAVEIVHNNQKLFESLMGFELFTMEEKQVLQEIYDKQIEFTKYLMGEKSLLRKNIIQLSKKENISNSYVAQKIEPVFVDKDFN